MDDAAALYSGAVDCKITPLVVFSILDHYMRRNEGQERVIGTLLGANNDGNLQITNCFPVPHTETDTVGIDMDFHKTMMALYRQSNPTEIIVGWYTTGDDINDHSILIHDFYGREIQRPPIHLCVGCDLARPDARGISLSAYMSSSVALKDRLFGSHFSPVPLAVAAEGSDRSVLAAASAGAVQTSLGAGLEQLEQQLQALLAHARSAAADPAVGRALLAALADSPAALLADAVYDEAVQDTLSVVYLGKLTRAQIKLCAELHALFANPAAAPEAAKE